MLIVMLQNVSPDWTSINEGGETWSVYDVIGHLIEGEKTDWIPRMEIILSDKKDKTFEPFDRFAQFEARKDETLAQRLDEFKRLRKKNLEILRSKNLIFPFNSSIIFVIENFNSVSSGNMAKVSFTNCLIA